MPDFNAKMHQNRFWLGLRPRPSWGAYSSPPDPVAGFKGPTSNGRGGALGLSASSFWQSWLYGPDIPGAPKKYLPKEFC